MSTKHNRKQRQDHRPSFEGLEARRLLSGCMFPWSVEIGTRGNDEIVGTDAADIIIGRSGDDTLSGMGGDDILLGGRGADVLIGGDGNDKVIGGSGDDAITGGAGGDKIIGGSGDDTITGGAGSDRILGGSGDDVFRHSVAEHQGSDSTDRYRGGRGRDTLVIDLAGLSMAEAEDIQAIVTDAFADVGRNHRVNFGKLGIDGLNVRMKGIEQIEFEMPAVQTEPPVAEDDLLSVFEGAALTFPSPGVLVNDVDPEGEPLFVSAVNGVEADVGQVVTLASGATLQMNADGSFVYDTNTAFDWMAPGELFTETFSYTAADGQGGFDTAVVSIMVFGM